MADPVARLATRLAYGTRQLPRVAWYVGHGMVMQRLAEAARGSAGSPARPRAPTRAGIPDRSRLYADMAALFRRDLDNVERGIYPLPADHDGSLPKLIERSRLFFEDLPDVHRRRESGSYREVLTESTAGKRPGYYLQNFHFQSGGWMTEDSAQRYDTQVEVLFKGTANATRRQALPPLAEAFAGRDQRRLQFLDVGCGTGRFLDFFKQAWPRLPAVGLDLSEAYVVEARQHLRRACWIDCVVGKAEALPFADESQDAVGSIFLFHELPPRLRSEVFGECARVLKPGGRLVIVDSLQLGDKPDYDGMLELFPQSYHEPYYAGYLREDFGALARRCGLRQTQAARAFVSKVMVFDKR
ncbi:MAG TPA: class I SAM-dependent methyltransferase [Xanthobacteraceae bacterium]|jgi:ubiquinone/menaquinone biosynthesis C-methylase UbiE